MMMHERVAEGESLADLSTRLGVPGCMLLRANRIFSAAWLLPGRVIDVPDADFCHRDGFICPVAAMHLPAGIIEEADVLVARGEDASAVAARTGLTERIVLRAAGRSSGPLPPGLTLRLPVAPAAARIVTLLPGDSIASIATQRGIDPLVLRQFNRLWGPAFPGMRIVVPERAP